MLKLIDISKKYLRNSKDSFYAVNKINYEFKEKGMYFIYGKSGSGKSTLLNLIAGYEKLDEGQIIFEDIDISKLKSKEISYYRNQCFSMIFQNYNVIEELSAIDNIVVKEAINGISYKTSYEKANGILNKLNINHIKNKKCYELSGGEKQRVAIARSLVNDVKMILADEPTGALDEENSLIVIQMLKEISKEKLVIVISHNYDLIMPYADYVLHLEDGKLKENHNLTISHNNKKFKISRKTNKEKFFLKYVIKKLKNNKIKNLLLFISSSFCLVVLLLISGFINGSSEFILKNTTKRFDYGLSTISKVEEIQIDNSFLKLNRLEKLDENELKNIIKDYHYINYEINCSKLFENSRLLFNDELINSGTLSYVYNFSSVDSSLIIEGENSFDEGIYINSAFKDKLKQQFNIDNPLGQCITINVKEEFNFKTNTTSDEDIKDIFVFDKKYMIKGVVDEFSFLSVPKIYLSYQDLMASLQNNLCINVSNFLNKDYSWYDYIYNLDNNDKNSSYSHFLFLNNYLYLDEYENFITNINNLENIEITCDGFILKNTFNDIIEALKIGLIIFFVLVIIGTILIIGLSSYSNFAFQKRNNAIYLSLGMSNEQLFSIYIYENVFVLIVSLISSFIFASILNPFINWMINRFFNIENIVQIPFLSFLNVPFLLPILIILISLFVMFFVTYIPIYFSRNINIRKELQEE